MCVCYAVCHGYKRCRGNPEQESAFLQGSDVIVVFQEQRVLGGGAHDPGQSAIGLLDGVSRKLHDNASLIAHQELICAHRKSYSSTNSCVIVLTGHESGRPDVYEDGDRQLYAQSRDPECEGRAAVKEVQWRENEERRTENGRRWRIKKGGVHGGGGGEDVEELE
eukprot:2459838-Rhodomonas_salina.2